MPELSLTAKRGGQAGGVTLDPSSAYDLVYERTDWGAFAPTPKVVTRPFDGVSTPLDHAAAPRVITLGIDCIGSDHASLAAAIQALHAEVLACSRSGGRVRWKKTGAAYAVYFRILHATYTADQGALMEVRNRAVGTLNLLVDPLAEGDAMGFVESFNDLSGWTTDAAGGATVSAKFGRLLVTGGTPTLRCTQRGYQYTDAQVTVGIRTGAAYTNLVVRVGLTQDGAAGNNAIFAEVTPSATKLIARVAGSETVLATSGAISISSNTQHWLRLRREGLMLTLNWWASLEAEPGLADAAATLTALVTSATQGLSLVSGEPVLIITPHDGTEQYGPVRVEPFTMVVGSGYPARLGLRGIPGDAPATASIDFAVTGAPVAMPFGAAWWAPGQQPANYCWNGNAEAGTVQGLAGTAYGWAGTAGGTVVASTTAPWRGTAAWGISSDTTASSGGVFNAYRTARRGVPHIAAGMFRASAAGTVPMSLACNTATATALGTVGMGYRFLASPWLSAADGAMSLRLAATGSGTAIIHYLDAAYLGETFLTTIVAGGTISAAQTLGTVSSQPPGGWPAPPFYIAAQPGATADSQELIRVSAVTSGTILTLERGVYGGTARQFPAGGTIALLPAWDEWRGGVHALPLDFLPLAQPAQYHANQAVAQVDANTSNGYALAGTGYARYYLDPGSTPPPFAANDDMTIEVWPRLMLNGSATTPAVAIRSLGEEQIGTWRPGMENGTAGFALTLPSSGTIWRSVRADSIAVRVDTSLIAQRRVLMEVSPWTGNGTAMRLDHAIVAPVGAGRVASPTGIGFDAAYPVFLDTAVSGHRVRRIEHDLGGGIGSKRDTFSPQGGVIGDAIILPVPNTDMVVKVASLVPNDTVASGATEQVPSSSFVVSINPTPRFAVIR